MFFTSQLRNKKQMKILFKIEIHQHRKRRENDRVPGF